MEIETVWKLSGLPGPVQPDKPVNNISSKQQIVCFQLWRLCLLRRHQRGEYIDSIQA